MRLQGLDAENITRHAELLLDVGEGKNGNEKEFTIPERMLLPENSLESLIDYIYPGSDLANWNDDGMILAVTNKDVTAINDLVTARCQGDGRTYLSADSVLEREDVNANFFPIEFLNTLTLTGLPPHKLELKEGLPIILLRNLSTKKGLCNGTRLIIKHLHEHVLDCEVSI